MDPFGGRSMELPDIFSDGLPGEEMIPVRRRRDHAAPALRGALLGQRAPPRATLSSAPPACTHPRRWTPSSVSTWMSWRAASGGWTTPQASYATLLAGWLGVGLRAAAAVLPARW